MSDDIPRSAHGNRPPQRRSKAPYWWSGLERTDLPDEVVGRDGDVRPSGPWTVGAQDGGGGGRPRAASRRMSALIYLVVAATAIFLILIGVGASSTHSVLAALLVIAVPLGLAALAGSAVARRSGS